MKNEKNLRVGFGRRATMPNNVLPLGGNGLVGREYTGVADILYVTCIALGEEGQRPVLVYTMDTLKSERFIHPLREAVSEATGITGDRILISSTHTHSAPAVYANNLDVEDYRAVYRQAMIDAAREAMADMCAAQLQCGAVQTEGLIYTRHYIMDDGSVAGPSGGKGRKAIAHVEPADQQVQILRACREGKKDVLLLSCPIHGTRMSSEANKLISADVGGAIRTALEAKSDCLVAYFIGAAGNQVPTSRIEGEQEKMTTAQYGEKMAAFVLAALPGLQDTAAHSVAVAWHTYSAKSNKNKIHLVQQAEETVKAYSAGGQKEARPYLQKQGFSSVWEAVAIRRRAAAAATVEFPLAVLRLGALSFVFAPYEMFAPTGRYIKENTPGDMTFVVTCANGAFGYFPTLEDSGYDVYECFVTLVEPGTAEAVAAHMLAMIRQLEEK